MGETGIQPVAGATPETAGLTQWQRVGYTFASPSKTFEDIKRGNKSFWLPLILIALSAYFVFGTVVQRIGIRQVTENQIHMNPRAEDQMAAATPEQKEKAYKFWDGFTEVMFIGGPLIGLVIALIVAAVLMGTINFGFGGRAKFSEVFAVVYYAWLPGIIKWLLGAAAIWAGMAPESFNIKNFAPTNLGAFLDPVETNKALYALATSLDFTTVWTVALLGIGIATVAGVKRKAGYIAAFGWWTIIVAFSVGATAVIAAVTGG
jgi:Yip1 domain